MPKRNRELVYIICLGFLLACPFININSSASVSSPQIYWGSWVGDSHIGNYNLLTNFETQVGKGVSIWNWIQLWNRPQDSENIPNFDTALMNQARSHGAIPMVSWGPESSANNPGDMPYTNLQDVIDGNWDAYFTSWGQASAAWGHPFFARPFWEFTGSWNTINGINPWNNGNTPSIFIQAWQHMVNVVRNAGGTQISWVWCPGDVGDSVSTLQSVYPGDSYVDWVGTDIYGDLVHSGDAELANIHTAIPNKPVMIPEIGWKGANKGSYWSTLLTTTLPNQYPYVKAVVTWEMPSGGLTVVDSGTLGSFKQAISSSYYTSNTYSTLNVSPLDALPLTPASSPTLIPTSFNSSFLEIIIVVSIFIIPSIALFIVIAKKHKKRAERKTVSQKKKKNKILITKA
jgi:hypothetical protein